MAPDLENELSADIEIFGHHRSTKLPIYGAKVFAVRNGTIDIHGCQISKTWTVLSQTIEAGQSVLQLKDSIYDEASPMTSWKVGDQIAIATTGGMLSQKQSERRFISTISNDGYTLTLDQKRNTITDKITLTLRCATER